MFQHTTVIDRDQVQSKSLKARLNQIDDYLDVGKLITEIKSQHKDSYTLRMLLQRVKEHTTTLQLVESELQVKQRHVLKAMRDGKCVNCERLLRPSAVVEEEPTDLLEDDTLIKDSQKSMGGEADDQLKDTKHENLHKMIQLTTLEAQLESAR